MVYTYSGPAIDDPEILKRLPREIADSLLLQNGFIGLKGGLHIRGACHHPEWHSLRHAWDGPGALHTLFPSVRSDDIPLAEDCFGDQYLIRDGRVIRLEGETGELSNFASSWSSFLRNCLENPTDYLNLHAIERMQQLGIELEPGQLLSVYPPFVMEGGDVSLRPVPSLERIRFLADFARQFNGSRD